MHLMKQLWGRVRIIHLDFCEEINGDHSKTKHKIYPTDI